jgi:hypothetical protein
MRMVRAEMLKLARRRGTMIWSALLTIGSVVVANVIVIALHAADATRHGPAGGAENLKNVTFLLGGLGTVAAIIVGSAAGTQDVAAGVFRDLVVTGRPRRTLFDVRLPGTLLVFLPLVAIAFGIEVVVAYGFAGSSPTPSAGVVGDWAAYLFAVSAVNVALAIGLSAFASSRVVVGVLIAWNAIVANLLAAIHSLGGARKLLTSVAFDHFVPADAADSSRVAMTTGAAVLVLVAWVAVFQLAGRWWTSRRDA